LARILLLLVIAFLVYLVIKGCCRSRQKKEEPPAPAAATPAGEDMVACARCGVNLSAQRDARVDGRLSARQPELPLR
jgi:hypothetical protein